MASSRPYLLAAGLGVVAGLRSITAPAILKPRCSPRPSRACPFALPIVRPFYRRNRAGVLAVGELVVDKIPFIPARTKPGPLTGRALSGALCGAIVCHAAGESSLNGAAVGAWAPWPAHLRDGICGASHPIADRFPVGLAHLPKTLLQLEKAPLLSHGSRKRQELSIRFPPRAASEALGRTRAPGRTGRAIPCETLPLRYPGDKWRR